MRVCGIDASTNKTGIALFEDGKYIEHILLDKHKIKDVDERLLEMAKDIGDYVKSTGADYAIMEKSMLSRNTDTMQKLSFLMGAVMAQFYGTTIKFQKPLPSEWRKKIGLSQGKKVTRPIQKAEAIKAVEQEYGKKLTDDEAEAILIARSAFDLPKLEVTPDDVEDEIWG